MKGVCLLVALLGITNVLATPTPNVSLARRNIPFDLRHLEGRRQWVNSLVQHLARVDKAGNIQIVESYTEKGQQDLVRMFMKLEHPRITTIIFRSILTPTWATPEKLTQITKNHVVVFRNLAPEVSEKLMQDLLSHATASQLAIFQTFVTMPLNLLLLQLKMSLTSHSDSTKSAVDKYNAMDLKARIEVYKRFWSTKAFLTAWQLAKLTQARLSSQLDVDPTSPSNLVTLSPDMKSAFSEAPFDFQFALVKLSFFTPLDIMRAMQAEGWEGPEGSWRDPNAPLDLKCLPELP
ncbi:hypothetical protein FRB99_008720 [Tulasnella sp. 403]|nr:hypothetical protein FRB99_008720 [Tulasnella sp. 403]